MTERSHAREPDTPPDADPGSRRVGRRSCLKLAGLTVGSVSLFGRGVGATEGEFARTVNAIEAGCDPTGERSCDHAFQRAVGDDTELRFPSGTYRFDEQHAVLGIDHFAIRGRENASFVVPPGFNADLLTIAGGSSLSVNGIDIDMTAEGATPGLRLCARESLSIENVEFIGRGVPAERSKSVANALSPVVRSPDGEGRIRNVRAYNNAPIEPENRRSNRRSGLRIGGATRGTVTIADCRFDGFPGGGAVVSETSATIRIEGGRYRNNAAGLRFGGVSPDSLVRGTRVTTDENGPVTDGSRACGVRLEGGGAGATIENCVIDVGSSNGPALVVDHDYGGFSLLESRLHASGPTPAIRARSPHGGRYSSPRGSLETRIENCVLTSDRLPLAFADRPAPQVTASTYNGVPVSNATALSPDF